MANVADCAFAVAKKDLEKLGGAITKCDGIMSGSEQKYAWNIEKDGVRKRVISYSRYLATRAWGGDTIGYYEVNGEKMSAEDYDKLYSYREGWQSTNNNKVYIDKYYSNEWCVDWAKLGSYSYDSDTWVQEYDDHITVYFGGRWSFPSEVEDFLYEKGVEWQGAVVEDGCEVLDDELGNTDFNLRIEEEENEYDGDTYTTHYIEDTSTNAVRA